MLHVHRAEGGSALVAGLAEVLAVPPDDPFVPDVVAVPARGIERWIAQRLSHSLGAEDGDGVCALVDFPRPDALLDEAVAAASPAHAAAVEAWDGERAVWSLLDVLDACPADEQWCARLRHHLGLDGPHRSTRRYAVARRLTGLFTTYAASRPELLTAWARGEDEGVPPDLTWQPELWRRLRTALGTPSPAELLDEACAAVRARPDDVPLPQRLNLYGVSRLDAARLQVLSALAERRDVHVWLHHPSPALWQELQTGGAPVRRADVTARPQHPLLASLSRDVRELQLRLRAAAPRRVDVHHAVERPAPTTLLQRLQSDLRDDVDDAPTLVLDPHDRSVQVHACHGRARQVEVLREVVVGLLADDPTLEPRDVLVMCPDVETFAPLVAAVFGTDAHPGSRLRVALADRSPRQVNPVLGVAGQLLDLAAGRVTASQLLDLAGSAPVRRAFRFDDDALEQLRAWAVAAGVRWACTPEQRAPWHLDKLAQGTWQAGLDRVLTGVAVGAQDALVGGALPLEALDSSDVDLAGRLAELVDRVGEALDALRRDKPVGAWLDALEDATLSLCEVAPDGAWQLAQLRRLLGDLREASAGSTAILTLADATALLAERLAGRPTTTSFRTGGTTVCTLTPMRSVPHRVVCLLGLDDGAFPRQSVPDGDDLLARDPHLGERDPRSEDRQLLLDALLAAGDHLVVTYAGHDVRTGAELPPAVPLGELLDALDASAETAEGLPAREQVLVRHPLQPFDARNFSAGLLGRPGLPVSFDPVALAGARAAAGERSAPAPFRTTCLPSLEPEDVELDRLVEVLQHPAKAFLRQRLQVQAAAREEEPNDALPVELGPLDEWSVGDRLLRARLSGLDRATAEQVEKAAGLLPPGPLADGVLAKVAGRVVRLAATSEEFRAVPATTVDVTVPLGGRRLLGSVRGVRESGEQLTVLTVTYSRVRAKQRVRAWVELLALTAARPDREVRAVLVGRGQKDTTAVHVLGPVGPSSAQGWLVELAGFRDAALRGLLPLPLESGLQYAFARNEFGHSTFRARTSAAKEWKSTPGWDREDVDPEHLLVWDGQVPFDHVWSFEPVVSEPGTGWEKEPTAFARLARRLWEPLLEHETRTQK